MIGTLCCNLAKGLGKCHYVEPVIEPVGTISQSDAQKLIKARVKAAGLDPVPNYLPDNDIKVYNLQDMIRYLHLEPTSNIKYVKEKMDCDDFAACLFGKVLGLIWSNIHALNWFISDTEELWFVEPQTDKIAGDLKNWQGWQIRFFIGR